MYPITVLLPVFWFSLATVSFFLAIQKSDNTYLRYILLILHVTFNICCLNTHGIALYPQIVMPFLIGLAIHTTSILLVDKIALNLGSTPILHRLRAIYRTWMNIRRVELSDHNAVESEDGITPSRVSFSFRRLCRLLLLWLVSQQVLKVVSDYSRRMEIGIMDFAPSKQGLFPPMTHRDLTLRAITSVYWIWDSYVCLTLGHDFFAILFVLVLRWDLPTEWPPLFGSLADSYSIRRFWGVFWHRLHIRPFLAFTPSILCTTGDKKLETTRKRILRGAFRSLWIFTMSAGCHAATNYVRLRRNTVYSEMRFFLLNYVACLLETVAGRSVKVGTLLGEHRDSSWMRFLGYVWVFAFFFCTVPGWQYPIVYLYGTIG
ncbi:hypothetical protein F4776DRAFT_635904 [Hypoxylon sp. NC0597]|nr:hypothetical protein F4776DRAFT_635904 [Hypoxylon sp. NC0597]